MPKILDHKNIIENVTYATLKIEYIFSTLGSITSLSLYITWGASSSNGIVQLMYIYILKVI